jgi:hypothetical protein
MDAKPYIFAVLALAICTPFNPAAQGRPLSKPEKEAILYKRCGAFPQMRDYGLRNLGPAEVRANQAGEKLFQRDRDSWIDCRRAVGEEIREVERIEAGEKKEINRTEPKQTIPCKNFIVSNGKKVCI